MKEGEREGWREVKAKGGEIRFKGERRKRQKNKTSSEK